MSPQETLAPNWRKDLLRFIDDFRSAEAARKNLAPYAGAGGKARVVGKTDHRHEPNRTKDEGRYSVFLRTMRSLI